MSAIDFLGSPMTRHLSLITPSSTPPRVISLHPSQRALWRVSLPPCSGDVLVGLGERRIDVYGAQDLLQPDAVAHRRYVFDYQIAGVLTHYRRAQDMVLAGPREHLHHTMRL